MQHRPLGSTGVELSLIGFGGIALQGLAAEEASRLVSEAVDYGVNYFDSAPTYGDSERILGPALAPYRDRVLLACKTAQRHKETAARELDESLRALRTDYVDLYQVHEVDSRVEIETDFGPGGAMETFEAARQAGKILLCFPCPAIGIIGRRLELSRWR